jgi:hypothetical protein
MGVQRLYKVAADLRAAISINQPQRGTERLSRLDLSYMAARRSAATRFSEGGS